MQQSTQQSRVSTVALIFKKMKDKLFGNRLKTLRINKGYTQLELGEKLGLKESAIQSHEYGQWPNRNNLQKYLDFYNCDEAWLMTGQGEPYPDRQGSPVFSMRAQEPRQVAQPEPEYEPHGGWQPSNLGLKKEELQLIGQVYEILRTDTIYRQALVSNIRAFHAARESSSQLAQTRNQLDIMSVENKDLKNRMEILERKVADLDTISRAESKKSEAM